MKRIFFPVAALLLGVFTYSCQEEVGNPGDGSRVGGGAAHLRHREPVGHDPAEHHR